jgi:hypothetical protein
MKALGTIAIIAVILIAGVAGVIAYQSYTDNAAINSPEGRYKIDVTGKSTFDPGILSPGWLIEDTDYTVTRMTTSAQLNPFWWIWTSGQIEIEVILKYPGGRVSQRQTQDMGTYDTIGVAQSHPFAISIDMIPPDTSPYTLVINLKEDGALKKTQTITGIMIGS